jgi:hypothetical protein
MAAPPPTLYKYCPPERIDILDGFRVHFSPPSGFNDVFDSDDPVQPGGRFLTVVRRDERRNRLGVLCLTEKADNHLMWVHYAKGHTGFVLGFNANAPFLQEGKLGPIKYAGKPDRISDKKACFYKSKDWAHEAEWRCVREFKESESRLAAIEPELITEVVFGWNMDRSNISRIINALTVREMGPALFRSDLDRQRQTIVKRQVKFRPCPHCTGKGYHVRER